jgi:tetratricopeptide (TPR) repeat protein
MAIAVWMCGVPIVRPLEAPLAVAHAEQETPFDEATLWLAPPSEPRTPSDLARALSLMADDRAADAVPILVRQTGDAELGAYAHLHLAQAYLALGNEEDAIASLRVILEHTPGGYLGEAALSLLADGLAAEGKWVEAAHALQALTGLPSSAPQRAYLRLGQAAEKQGDKALARGAYTKIYYDWPLSAEASDAEDGLARVGAPTGPEVERLARGRAQALYAGRR